MIVMPANNTGVDLGILVGRYPGRIGHLYSPGKNPYPRQCIPYALDNGAFSVWIKGLEFDDAAFRVHLKNFVFQRQKPLWILAPDVVANKVGTLCEWSQWEPELRAFNLPLAFAVQDGMESQDVPETADVVFVGGTTEWKWKTLPMWASKFPRVHVGRVNSLDKLWICHDFGCESCDGTGWFRGDRNQIDGLNSYLRESSGGRTQMILDCARKIGPDDER